MNARVSPAPRLHRLSNGVRLVVDPMAALQSCALSVVVDGGARWEDQATSGWSHLLEHMVFKGAGGRDARGIVEAVENRGGQINAATGYERTSFQVRCLPEGLGEAMAVLGDLVRHPTLTEADLEQEKAVIAQEIAEAADQPDDRVFDLAQGCAFGVSPLGRPILGDADSIGTADAVALGAFHRRLYAAERLVISAAGAVDEDSLIALAEAAFGDGPLHGGACNAEPASFLGGRSVESRRLEQAHLVLLLEGLAVGHADDYALRLYAEILGGGMASRLFQTVRESMGLAYNIDAFTDGYADTGVLGVYAGTSASDAGRAVRTILDQAEQLAEAPLEAELARAKAQMRAGLYMGRESPLSRAEQAAAQLHIFGRLIDAEETSERIDAVSLEDLRRAGRRALATPKPVAALVGPRRAVAALDALGDLRAAA